MTNTIFLDVETTGIGEADRLVQLAYKSQGATLTESLFKPSLPMSIEAMSVCHITDKMLEECETFKDSSMYKELQDLFDNPDCIFVAHNAQFDMKFLEKEGLKLPPRHICTLKLAHDHDKKGEVSKHNLQFLRYLYNLEFDGEISPHDAASDIIVLEKLFAWYTQYYTIPEMVEISSRPILLKKLMFGKYKGEWFKDIIKKDADYLRWMRREMKMEDNLKYTVNYYLESR